MIEWILQPIIKFVKTHEVSCQLVDQGIIHLIRGQLSNLGGN